MGQKSSFSTGNLQRGDDGYLVNPTGGIIWGYARVSTTGQNTRRQDHILTEYGVNPKFILTDKQSGKNFNRPQWKALMKMIGPGDIIVVTSLDRLGRNYDDIIEQWKFITQEVGCGIYVVDMPILNVSGDPQDLLSKFVVDLILQVLSFVAENELQNIHERQESALRALEKLGDAEKKRRGRPPKAAIDYRMWELYISWRRRDVASKTLAKIAREELGISERSFYRTMHDLNDRYGEIGLGAVENFAFEDCLEKGLGLDMAQANVVIPSYDSFVKLEPMLPSTDRTGELPADPSAQRSVADQLELQGELLRKRQKAFRKRFDLDDYRWKPPKGPYNKDGTPCRFRRGEETSRPLPDDRDTGVWIGKRHSDKKNHRSRMLEEARMDDRTILRESIIIE